MLTRWDAVSTLDRMFDDVMGSMLGTATSPRTFDPTIDLRTNENDKAGEQVMLGRPYGSFKRAFTLPDGLDDASPAANLADGVLTIRIPKQPKAKPRKIAIGNEHDSKQLGG